VVTPSIRHVPPQYVDSKMKNRSRLSWYIADQQTHNVDPKAITLLLDLNSNVTECSGANFVIVERDTIVSPTRRNILQGVSLSTVRELAPKLGMKFIERDFQPFDVVNANEARLTTTPYCMDGSTTHLLAMECPVRRSRKCWRRGMTWWAWMFAIKSFNKQPHEWQC
jgi:branched-chain amino acid aminotransferase